MDWSTAGDLVGNTIKVFVPGVGMVQGVVQAVSTGDPRGVARVLVPGIGVIEGAVGAGTDVWQATSGPVAENIKTSIGGFVILGVAIVAAVLLLKD